MIFRPAFGVGVVRVLLKHLDRYTKSFSQSLYYVWSERGVRGVCRQLAQMGELKFGNCRGNDEFGNKYYENTVYQFGRDRWVEYSNLWHFDMSQVPAAWYGWLAHMTDMVPSELEAAVRNYKATPIVEHSDAIYKDNIGYQNGPYQENQTYFRPRGYGMFGYNDGHGAHPTVGTSYDMRVSYPLHPEFEANEDNFDKSLPEETPEEKIRVTGHHTPANDLEKM